MYHTDEKIHGFDLTITPKELRDRLMKRVKYHESRIAFYKTKASEFSEDREKIQGGVSNRTLGRHEDEIMRSADHHVYQARFLRFFAEHLPEQQLLPLTHRDLVDLELLDATLEE